MVGECLLFDRLRTLTWDQLDLLQAGQDVRRQKDLAAIRLLAAQDYNLAVEKQDRLAPKHYLWLPAVDGPRQQQITQPNPGHADWKARMKEKYGDLMEE